MQENDKRYDRDDSIDIPPVNEFETEAKASENSPVQSSAELPSEESNCSQAEGASSYHWDYSIPQDPANSKKKKNSAIIYAAVMTGAFIISFAVLLIVLLTGVMDTQSPNTPSAPSLSGTPTSERIVYVREYDPESGVLTTQEIYNKCLPAIVSISVTTDDGGAGIGSGFIISEDGYIVTANHVIDGMKSINVILNGGVVYSAEVIDGNAFTDIALIKIEASDLPTIKIGKSADLLVGDNVVAIGTPASIDFAGSLAAGHISYQNRTFKIYNEDGSVEKKMTLIQTNALVNPGNSGCPLINEYGEAVGIVTMKLNSTYYEGMCFAIPMDTAMPILDAMRDGKDYDHLLSAVSTYPAKLGISIKETTVPNTDEFGIRIDSFTSNSYDIVTKMKVGDIITKFNGVSFSSSAELTLMLDKCSPGDTVSITFYRNGQYMTVNVVLGR